MISATLRSAIRAAALGMVVLTAEASHGQMGYYFSTGDNQQIGRHMPVDSEASIAALFDLIKDVYGVDRVYWRGLQASQIADSLVRPEAAYTAYHFQWQNELMDGSYDLNKVAVQLAHDRGMEIWGEAALYDWGYEGNHASNLYGWPGIVESNLRLNNPEWVPVDRFGVRRQSGPIEFGYEEAREAVADWVDQKVTYAGYDGVIFHTFAENYSTQYIDEFGYNDPVVADFADRYGVDIRREAFDVQALRDLRGEYTTAFLQELNNRLAGDGVDIAVGVNGADADQPMSWLAGGTSFPLAGTMTIQWQQWVDQGLVDELHLGQNYTGADASSVISYTSGTGVTVSALGQNPYATELNSLKAQGVRAVGAGTTLEEFMRNSVFSTQPISSLQSPAPYLRMKTLGQVIDGETTATLAELAPLVNDSHILVRRMAMKALGVNGDPGAQPLLEQAMFDPDSAISSAAVYALRLSQFNKNGDTVDLIMDAMAQSGKPTFLEEAMATLLLGMNPTIVRPKMTDAIVNHPNTDARRLAARTLWNLGGGNSNEVRQALTTALGDADPMVRFYAAATHAFVYPTDATIDNLLMVAGDPDTVVATQATTSIGEWFGYGFASAINRKQDIVDTLDTLFANYGDNSTASNADWGYETVGRVLLQIGDEGRDVLRDYMTQRDDRLLSERAWSLLYYDNSKGLFDYSTVEEAESAYLRRPRWEAITALSDSFDSASNGQALASYTPDTGLQWEVLYGDPNLQILQDQVARSGMALELRREFNSSTSNGVRLTGHLYDTAVAEQTVVTASTDWLREDTDTFGWFILDVGHDSVINNPAVIMHTSGTYWVTDGGGALDTGIPIGSVGWESLEIVLTWGIAEDDTVAGTYDVFLTRYEGNALGVLDRLLIADDMAVLATDLASLQQLILLNDANLFGDAVTYWDNILLHVAPDLPVLDGDLNGDGFVGIDDLNIVLGNWNQTVPPGDPAADPSGDGFVGIDDLNTVLGNWNAGAPPTAAVPEPTTGALLLTCLFIQGRTFSRKGPV